MSNTETSYIKVHDGGKLIVEDVNLAIYGEHPLPKWGGDENYYSATQVEGSEWIKVRTKWIAPVGDIAQLACKKQINLTMEFDSLDNSEVGSMQFCYKRIPGRGRDVCRLLSARVGAARGAGRDGESRAPEGRGSEGCLRRRRG
jgi:hypothetical protein